MAGELKYVSDAEQIAAIDHNRAQGAIVTSVEIDRGMSAEVGFYRDGKTVKFQCGLVAAMHAKKFLGQVTKPLDLGPSIKVNPPR